jgi:formylglycine-generating enzyme required for sulfatase activity
MRYLIRLVTALSLITVVVSLARADEFVFVPGGNFESVVPEAEGDNDVSVPEFWLQDSPVTNAEFLRFVLYNPEWQREAAVALFVDDQYLANWSSSVSLDSNMTKQQPVVQVSWFAAHAYCESLDARLPTWYEWEYVAAADEQVADAREIPEWRQEILSWYSERGGERLKDVKDRPANFYGVFDTHGLVWEWVDDYNALLVTGDNREQGGADALQFCGAGAITMEEKENYAVLMRVAMLSSLEARYTTRNLGFRCARDSESLK